MPFENKLYNKEAIEKLLKDFASGKSLKRSKIIDRLGKRIAEQMTTRKNKDICEWAELLSEDVSKLDD
ncbi:hypothetical protein LCGC14_0570470 [marine sediment metagenome]|uniref:Uncharacterized protein n=1 Tax=marine sediment metagenome TaxID=412755 RepID=A0A0F9RJD6_9ZZZZ|nr:hypothetical protein [Pricia sp.]